MAISSIWALSLTPPAKLVALWLQDHATLEVDIAQVMADTSLDRGAVERAQREIKTANLTLNYVEGVIAVPPSVYSILATFRRLCEERKHPSYRDPKDFAKLRHLCKVYAPAVVKRAVLRYFASGEFVRYGGTVLALYEYIVRTEKPLRPKQSDSRKHLLAAS